MKPLFLRLIPTLFNDSQPTTAREDARDLCRVLAEVGLSGLEWDPWAWKRNVSRVLRSEERLKACVDSSSDSSSEEEINGSRVRSVREPERVLKAGGRGVVIA
jgi:hypothetical protein